MRFSAVALEFVISVDELLFESLAPARAKYLVSQVQGFKCTSATSWRGLDGRTAMSLLFVFSAMGWAAGAFMADQNSTLSAVKAAICAGDLDFVFAIDAMGLVRCAIQTGTIPVRHAATHRHR